VPSHPTSRAQDIASAGQRKPVENPFELAIDAAGMGTWNWDLASGHVAWAPRTYQLFGFTPGVFESSHEAFLRRVHPEDREAVVRWCDQALRQRTRTALEFRIVRSDETVRWIRSTGRAMTNEDGCVVRMVGVVDDVTEERVAKEPLAPAGGNLLSVRDVARLLGVAEVTLKRIVAAGGIRFLQSSRKNSYRFALEHVAEYLRRKASPRSDFASAVQALDVSAVVLQLIEALLQGGRLEDLLDSQVRPACRNADKEFVSDLLSRIPFIAPERSRARLPALLVNDGTSETWDAEFIVALLRANGREVLSAAQGFDLAQCAELAERVRAQVVVLLVGRGASPTTLHVAAEIGRLPSAKAVCMWSCAELRAPAGVTRLRSMADLGTVLRGLRGSVSSS